MGCNAWNHPSYCTCGWGGDGHAGRRTGSFSAVTVAVVDGFTWRFDREPTHDSYVNPNARCPVCGASVYFYQSPFGGKVFFDELGPPWPKHGCTDHAAALKVPVYGEVSVAQTSKAPPLYEPGSWRPLIIKQMGRSGSHDRVELRASEKLAGSHLYVPHGWVGDAPAMWRYSKDDPGFVEISCIKLNEAGVIQEENFSVPSWLRNDEEFEAWLANPHADPSAEALNAIGFAYSFGCKLADGPSWYVGLPTVDFAVARSYFERSAAKGFWAAINNLGVMYRDGLGVAVDHSKAFQYFHQAAQSLEPISMQHLSRCYREGLGCSADSDFAAFIEELIVVRDEERAAASA